MNIKTWITDLKQATMAVESFKNISMTFKGIGLNSVIDDITVTKYTASIKGLTLEQAKLALSTTQLSAHEKELILTKAGLISETKALTATQIVETAQKELGNKTDAKSLLVGAGIITNKELEENATIQVTWAKLEEAVANGLLTTEQSKLIASIFGVTGANYGEAVSFEVLTKAIWANIVAIAKWLVTNPIGWIVMATGLIIGIVVAYNKWGDTLENTRERLSNLKEEYDSIQSDLESINSELQTTIDRMNELERKESLTFSEQEEYDNLVRTNNELERKLALLELQEKQKKEQMHSDFVKAMEKDVDKVGEYQSFDSLVTEKEYINQQFKLRQKHYQTLISIEQDYLKSTSEVEKKILEKDKKYYQNLIENIDNYLTNKNELWVTDSEGLSYISNPSTEDEEAVNEWLDYINDFQDRMAIAMGGENAKTLTFNRLIDNWKFDEVVQELQDLGKQSQVTADMLNDPKYDTFINKLVELGVIDSSKNLDDVANAFNGLGIESENAEPKVKSTIDVFNELKSSSDSLKETLDDTFSNQSTIQSALDKIREGTSLSADEVLELVEVCGDKFPEISTMFEKTADGWTIAADDLINANDAIIESMRDMVQDLIDGYKKVIEEYEETTRGVDWTKGGIPSPITSPIIDTPSITQGDYKTAVNGLAEANLWMKVLGVTTDETSNVLNNLKTKYDEVSDATSNLVNKAKSLSDAFAEQNENGSLSTETALSLIENGYTAALMYDAETGAVKLDRDATLALAQAKLIEQKSSIYNAKNDAFQKKLEAEKNAATIAGGSILYTAEAVAEYNKQVAIAKGADELYNSLVAQEKVMDELGANLNDILNGTYDGGGSSSDPIKAAFDKQMRDTEHAYAKGLISQEEYLNALEQANKDHYEKVKDTDEYADAYNSNIEKIYNGRKDLYKEAVDEEISYLEQQYEKGFLTALEYQAKLTELNEKSYGMGTLYYDTEFATENYDELDNKIADIDSDVYEEQLKELEKANDGSIEAERQFIEKWKSLNKTMFEDTDPKKYKENLEEIAEYEDDWLVRRAENEKTYWENLKQEVEDYYDKEIEKLQSILDEEERINKQEELRNNLIKARQDLENAKKNRNQLVFANGSFEYTVDQEAVEQAAEAEKDAQRELERFEIEQDIKELDEQRNEKLDAINAVIEKVDEHLKELNGETNPTSSDSQVISNAGATDEANKAQNAYDSLGKDDKSDTSTEVKTDTVVVEQTGQSTSDDTGIQGVKQLYTIDEAAKILADRLGVSVDSDAWKNFATSVVSNGNPQSSPLSGIQNQNVYNNSTVDNSIRIDTINNNVTVAEGTTKQQVQSMLDGFASEVVDSLKSLRTKTT